ncbi:prolipoprotein diacylglyceryl transferase [Candidatus Gracilibacteria bacterium]|nr:prolipoprotein diacylglyceryl transferase [Candidatus Gracilibacteria bacterium]
MYINTFEAIALSIGPVQVRWYGMLFALGIFLNYWLLAWIFKKEGISQEKLDSVVMYLFIGLVVGARLGEVLFYNPGFYFSNPWEILKIWKGGLASHGATIGLFVAFWIWAKKYKVRFLKYADLLALGVMVTGAFVRIGNFFNSEIVGIPTGSDYGVVFARLGEDFARHPVQLYEAGLQFGVFAILMAFYLKGKKKRPGFYLFTLLLLYFGGRIALEYFKARQVIPEELPFTMGQLLSVVPVLAALFYFVFYRPRTNNL